jgi:hypothetical protein
MGVFVCLPDLFSSFFFRPPDMFRYAAALAVALLAAYPRVANAGPVVINELYYDHPGGDDGFEFVELINVSAVPVSVEDVRLEFHNGTGLVWEALWTGQTGEIEPGGLYVIGGRFVSPPPDAVAGFSIQNGPDAVRVCVGGEEADRVGYGGLNDPEWCETAGAAAIDAGRSLARLPDGADSGNNAADFSPAGPSPGVFNVARRDVSIGRAGSTAAAAVLAPGGFDRLWFEVTNNGVYAVAPGEVAVEVVDSTALSVAVVDTRHNTEALAPGDRYSLQMDVSLTAGYHWVTARTEYGADERTSNNAATVLRRVGTPALIVSELLCYPRDGCPQFVELYNAGPGPLDIGGFVLRDRSHDFSTVTSSSVVVPAGGFVVVTPDAAALERFFPSAPAGSVVEHEGSWPSLNRTGSGGVADSIVVGDAMSLTVDAISYPPPGSENMGRSLERIDLYRGGGPPVWVLSSAPAGATPGQTHGRALHRPPGQGTIEVTPRTFAPHSGETVCVAVETADGTRVVAGVHDTRGRRLAELGSAVAFPALFVWDGRDPEGHAVPPGLYIVVCEFFAAAGERLDVQKVVVGCGRRRRL